MGRKGLLYPRGVPAFDICREARVRRPERTEVCCFEGSKKSPEKQDRVRPREPVIETEKNKTKGGPMKSVMETEIVTKPAGGVRFDNERGRIVGWTELTHK